MWLGLVVRARSDCDSDNSIYVPLGARGSVRSLARLRARGLTAQHELGHELLLQGRQGGPYSEQAAKKVIMRTDKDDDNDVE